jgi:2-polyprenyl-3-methyl-5-hydroxy-6-metoxy-1,4-benzoquinol methylase
MDSPGNAREAYDEWHAKFDPEDDAHSPWHALVREHVDVARDLDGRRVLDIGCGRGGLTAWIARSSRPALHLAMDFSEVAVEKGRRMAAQASLPDIEWGVADIQDIPRADASIDSAFSCETIEHVPDPPRAVRELARVLRPGGRLFLTTPNYMGTLGLYRGYLRLRGRKFTEIGQPINQFTMLPRTIRWVTRAGLEVLATDAVGHYLPFPGRPAIRLAWLDEPRALMRWLAHHSFVLARKPS